MRIFKKIREWWYYFDDTKKGFLFLILPIGSVYIMYKVALLLKELGIL